MLFLVLVKSARLSDKRFYSVKAATSELDIVYTVDITKKILDGFPSHIASCSVYNETNMLWSLCSVKYSCLL